MHPGDIVAGKYRVSNIIGRTNGYLLEARHTEFEQRVVVRLLSPHLCDKKEIESFRREARTLSRLESEHVARLIDVGTHSDGSFYLVRQYLEGIDLATHLYNQGAITLDEAVLFTLQAGEAVQECHSHNILLRELSPAHLFLTQRRGGTPMVKIIDFGTAKLLRDPGEVVGGEATATVMFGMTPYSSPELVRKNRALDARTDVWSLGCIFYELLAAVPPFQGDAAELMLRITRDDPIPLSQLRPDVPRELDQIVTWALAKDPASRFSSVYAMAHALKPFASPEGQVLIDRIGRLAHTKDTDRPVPPPVSPTSPLSKRSGSVPPPRAPERTMLMPTESYESYDEVEFERTQYLGDDAYGPGSHPGGPPPSSRARTSSRGSMPPPSHPGGSGSWSALAIDPDPHGSPYSTAGNTGGWPAPTALGQQQRTRQRKAAVIAFGASLLLLPALVMVLVVMLRGQAGLGFGSPQTTETDREPPATQPPKNTSEASSAAPGINTEPPTPVEARDDGEVPDRPAPRRPTPVGKFPPQPPQKTARATPLPPADPEPDEDDEPEGGGETGTLVAIAIGGSCAFAVDGAPHGNKSSIRVSVPIGPHTVSCSPKGKAPRTQRVNVRPGKPGMATFRLN